MPTYYFRDAESAKNRRGRKEFFSGFFGEPVRVVVLLMIGHHEAAKDRCGDLNAGILIEIEIATVASLLRNDRARALVSGTIFLRKIISDTE